MRAADHRAKNRIVNEHAERERTMGSRAESPTQGSRPSAACRPIARYMLRIKELAVERSSPPTDAED
jgi:hypothetical protein